MSKFKLFLLLAVAVGGAALLARLAGVGAPAAPPGGGDGRASADSKLPQNVEGAVVYEHRGGIYKTGIGGGETTPLAAEGAYPRWSPDGRHIAFLRGGALMRVSSEGGEAEELVKVADPRAVAYHPGGKEILFTDGKKVRSYLLESGEVRTVLRGHRCLEIDVTADGRRLVATVKKMGYSIYAFDLDLGAGRKLASGCSASLSPDGGRVTHNGRSHRRLALLSWESGEEKGAVSAPAGLLFDNHFWSNDEDWIASRSEGDYEDIFIHRVSTDTAYRITTSGETDRPDLFLRVRKERRSSAD